MSTMLYSIPEGPDEEEVSNPLSSVGGHNKDNSALFVERMVILGDAAESLLCKLYELYTMSEFLEKSFPKLSELLVKKFPTHPKEINLQKLDKKKLQSVLGNVEGLLGNLKPWYYCLVDVMEYYRSVVSVLGEANELLRTANDVYVDNLLKTFAQTAADAIRVQILLASAPRKLVIQLYSFAYYLDYRSKPISGFDSHEKPNEHDDLLLFCTRFESVIPCLQQDFADFQSVFEKAINSVFGPYCTLASSVDTLIDEKIFKEASEYNFGPLENVTHQKICENLIKEGSYKEWTLWLSIACPMILTNGKVIDYLRIMLENTLLLPVFRDINLWIHAEILTHAYPKMKQTLKLRKQPRQGHKTNLRSMVVNSFTLACEEAPEKHLARREFALQVLNYAHSSLLYNEDNGFSELQQCMAALSFAKSEVIWHMHHWKEEIPQGLPSVLKLPYGEPLVSNCSSKHILKIIQAMKVLTDELYKQEQKISFNVTATVEEKSSQVYQVLKGFDEGEHSVTSKCIKSILLLGFPQAGGSVNFTAMRISWLRYLTVYPISKLAAIDKASKAKYDYPLLAEVQDLVSATYTMDKLNRQLSKLNDMKVIYFFTEKFNEIVDDSLEITLDIDENLPGILAIHKGFLKNNHTRCVVIVDDDIAKPVEHLLERISQKINEIVLQIEAEGYGTYEGASDIVRVSKASTEKRKGRSNKRQSHIFDILDQKIASPSLLGKYKMLLGLVKVLSEAADFELPKCKIKPKGYLYCGLKSAFESFLSTAVGMSEPYPDPSALLPKISKFIMLLQSFQSATTLNIRKLVTDVLYEEIPSRTKFRMPIAAPHSDKTAITISEKYAMWYHSSIVGNKNILYSPKLRTFSNGNFFAGDSSSYIRAHEFKAFFKIFGLYGVVAFWNEIEKSIADSLNTLFTELTNNQTFIAEVIFATSQRGDTATFSALEAKALILDPAIDAAKTLGRCIHLLDALSHAAQLAFGKSMAGLQESLVHALETNASQVLEQIEFQQTHLLSYAAGRKIEGVNPVVRSIFLNMSISGKSFDLIEQLFASFLSHSCWKSINYYPESETLDQDILSVGLAFRHLGYLVSNATPGVASENDRQNVADRFESFLETAAPLIFADEKTAGPKILFTEYMLDDMYFSQSILEKHVPAILVKSIKQTYLDESTKL